jgi:hypothetical protein
VATAVRDRKWPARANATARAPCGVFSTTTTCETPRSSTATKRVAGCSEVVTYAPSHTRDGAPSSTTSAITRGRGLRESGPVEDRYRYVRLDARVDKVRGGAQVVRERLVARTPCSRPGAAR